MKKQICFSVIIPTHNRPKLLERALLSIKSQMMSDQCEIIVVSDQTDSQTSLICDKYLESNDIFIRRNGLPGPAISRNIGLKMAKGQNILFLDDDDTWQPNLLINIKKSAYLKNGIPIYFNCSVVKESRLFESKSISNELFIDFSGALTLDVYVKNIVHMSCYAFPSFIIKNLTFDPILRAYEDWDFLLNVFNIIMPKHEGFIGSKIFEVDDETTDRRGSSKEATDFNAVMDYIYIYRKHPAPNNELKEKRANLLKIFGLNIMSEML